MGVVGRLDQYASMLAGEFDETTANNTSISGLGTYYASEFNENIVEINIVTSGLILNLDAGNLSSYSGSGTTWFDLSGNGNNATLVNGPTYSGVNGGVFNFNGTNQYASSPINVATSNHTIIAIARLTGSGNNRRVIASSSVNYLMGWHGGGTDKYYANGWVYDGGGAALTTWICYAAVGNYSTDSWQLYKNGVALGTPNNAGANGPNGLIIGGDTIYGEYSNCQVAVVLAYNRVLSAAEIQQNYNALTVSGRFDSLSSGTITTATRTTPLMFANIFSPYDLVSGDFGGTLFGAGQGRYMRQNTDKSVIVYNEIDEVTNFVDQLRGIVLFVSTPPAAIGTLSSDGSKLVFAYGPYPSSPTVYIASSPYTTWNSYSGPGGGGRQSITYINGFYFICGAINSAQFHRSPDAINWTSCNISGNGASTTYSFVYNSARSEWVTGGGSWVGTNCVRKSTDGLNFSLTYTYPSGTSGTTFLATSNLDNASAYMYRMETGSSTTTLSVARSQDAITWTESNWVALNGTSLLRFLEYFNGRYWACNSSNVLGTTTDGLTWTNYSNTNLDFQMSAAGSFVYGSTTYSYISGNNVFALSTDGITWRKYTHSFSTLYQFNIIGFAIYATNGTSIYKII